MTTEEHDWLGAGEPGADRRQARAPDRGDQPRPWRTQRPWMEMWLRARRDDTARLNYLRLLDPNLDRVVVDTTPQFVTVLDPGLTGQSV